MPTASINWTDEKVEELKRLWTVGLSASAIAGRMDVTRNAIIGKAHRLGLESRKSQADPEEQERKKQEKLERAAARLARKITDTQNRRENKVEQPTIPTAAPAFIGSLQIPFADLRRQSSSEPNQCRFIAAEPAGPEYLACGTETLPGESWCAHCKGIVYARPVSISNTERERRSGQATRNWMAAVIKQKGPAEASV